MVSTPSFVFPPFPVPCPLPGPYHSPLLSLLCSLPLSCFFFLPPPPLSFASPSFCYFPSPLRVFPHFTSHSFICFFYPPIDSLALLAPLCFVPSLASFAPPPLFSLPFWPFVASLLRPSTFFASLSSRANSHDKQQENHVWFLSPSPPGFSFCPRLVLIHSPLLSHTFVLLLPSSFLRPSPLASPPLLHGHLVFDSFLWSHSEVSIVHWACPSSPLPLPCGFRVRLSEWMDLMLSFFSASL